MRNDVIARLAAANPVPRDGPRHEPEPLGLRKPLLGVALAAALLAIAGVAVAAGFGAFEGTPPPPAISSDFRQLNAVADAATQQGFAHAFPDADVSQAHGVIEVQTADGPEDMWAAPNDQGGQCYFIDWANDPIGQNGIVDSFGSCPTAAGHPIDLNGPLWSAAHPKLVTLSGSVSVDATSLQITFDDGSTATVPVVEHLFLVSLAKPAGPGPRPVKAVAFDASGNQLADWPSSP